MRANYPAAVAYATEFLRQGGHCNKSSGRRVEPTEFLYIFGLQIKQGVDDNQYCSTFYKYPPNAFKFLFMKSKTDKGAFDIASRIVATKLFRDEPLNVEERVFAGQLIAGIAQPPSPEGKRLAASFSLNVHLVYIARLLVKEYALNLTRNDVSATKDSACDAVSEA